MPRPLRRYALVLCLAGGACSGDSDPDTAPGSDDGSGDTGAAPVTTGAGPTTVEASTGPDVGSTSVGDSSGGPPTSGSTGSEGSSGDDTAVTGSTGTTGSTGPDEPVGSAGCGNLSPPSGALEIAVQGQMGQYIVSVPPGYDPLTPYPLGFAFHGRNRTGPNCQDGDCAGFQAAMQDAAVLVYMTSLGGTGWEGDGEREINVEFFTAVLDDLLASACIDASRVFAAGTSSGAHFVNILGCRFGDRLLAIAPVAGYLPEKDGCVDSVAALVIHGFKDPHVPLSAGEEAREFWRTRNGCSDTTQPSIAEVHAAAEATPESHSCAVFDGCEADLPVVWCEHSEGGYDDSTHGWPLFGGQQIWEFVQSLP